MKPGKIDWAANDNYAAGSEIGNPTKIPPPSGRQADGFEPNKPPAAAWWNFLEWSINERLDNATAMRVKNWSKKSTNTIAWGATVFDGVVGFSRPISLGGSITRNLQHLVVEEALAAYEAIGIGGEQMVIAAAGGVLPQDIMYDGVSDSSGNAAVCLFAALASGLYYSLAATPTTWVAWAGTVLTTYTAGTYDEINSRFIFYKTGVGIDYAATPGAALTAVAVGGAGAVVSALRASNHDAGDLYPDDPGNDVKLLFTTNGALYRSLGNAIATWSNVGPAPFVPAPASERCLGYSKLGSRWGCIVTNGPGTARPTFAYSDDNGSNWVEVVDSFDFVGRGYGAYSYANDSISLACDGFGHWLMTAKISDASADIWELWASIDNGLTWDQVHAPASTVGTATNADKADCWYGDGAFWAAHVGRVGALDITDIVGSLRSGE